MKNLSDLREYACSYIEAIKKKQCYDENEIKQFCQLSNLILNSLKVEIIYNQKNEDRKKIPFIEEYKLIDITR